MAQSDDILNFEDTKIRLMYGSCAAYVVFERGMNM